MNNKSTASFPCLVFVVFSDAKNQLVRHDSVTQNASFTYEYDKAGNITARKRYAYTTGTLGTPTETRNYLYGNSSWGDLLTSYNGLSITYDGMGNMKTYNGRTYSWNGRELSGISGGGNTYSYKYNAAGFRTSKTVNGTTTEYFLNGSQLLAQKTGDTHLWFFYDSEGNRVGLISGGLIFYYLYNVQGDVVAIVRAATGEIVARYSYDAWGNCTVTNAEGYVTGTKNPFRYRGYYYDAESGMYYLGSRYYDPELGRFISPDVFVSTGQGLLGCNMFAYCGNNPVSFIDSDGLRKVYAIVYGGSTNGFIAQAQNSPYYDEENDEIILIEVVYAEDFVNAWNNISNYSDIDDVYLYVHGAKSVLYFGDGTRISNLPSEQDAVTFSQLNDVRINGKVYLFSCDGGAGGKKSVAFSLAEKTRSIVRACTGHVSYSKINNKYYARISHDFGIWKNYFLVDNPFDKSSKWLFSIIGR